MEWNYVPLLVVMGCVIAAIAVIWVAVEIEERTGFPPTITVTIFGILGLGVALGFVMPA